MFASQLLRIIQTIPTSDADDIRQVEELNHCEDSWSSPSSLISWESKVKGKSRKSPDGKLSSVQVVKEIIYHHEDVADAGSGLLERDSHRFGDKDELGCDVPELSVCYKDIDYHIVDDEHDKLPIYGDDDDIGIDLDVSASDESMFLSSVRAIDYVRDHANLRLGSFFEESSNKSKYFITEKLMKINNNSVSTGESVDKDFQISPRKAETNENRSAKEETKKIEETNCLCYESEVEDGIITFKFNSSSPVSTSHIVNQMNDRFKEKSLDSAEFVHKPASKDLEGNNNSNPHHSQAQCKKSGTESSVIITKTEVKKDHYPLQDQQQQPFDLKRVNSSKSQNQESISSSDSRHGKSRQESSVVISEDRNMESSANRLITCIEALERNGSQSTRSDGHGTSMRSFTFPASKGEWDKSPRKMGNEADERQHKNRRSRLYSCCMLWI